MTGGVGDPLVQDVPLAGKPAPVPVSAPPLTPNGGGGRIVLAKPALTGNALLDAEYETWLYAAVVTPSGAFNGLFVTKDDGANWTDVRIPDAFPATATAAQGLDPTNNISEPNYYLTGGPASGQGNYDIALAVDPVDPNIVYVGGSADFGPTTMIRVDITRLADPYSLYASTETNGGQILPYNTSPVSVPAANLANFSSNLQYSIPDPLSAPYTNLYRNPADVFQADSTVYVYDTASFSNDGSGAWYTPFSGFVGGTDVHQILTIKDPTTGLSRLLVGYDQGIATGVDDGGTILSSIGGTQLATGVANGNLQITQFYNGAAQPSALAAQVADALFYGMAQDDGFPESEPERPEQRQHRVVRADRRRDRRRHRPDGHRDDLRDPVALLQRGRPGRVLPGQRRRPDLRPAPVDERPAGQQPARHARPAVALRPVDQLRRQPDRQPGDDHRLARRPPLRHDRPGGDLDRAGRAERLRQHGHPGPGLRRAEPSTPRRRRSATT